MEKGKKVVVHYNTRPQVEEIALKMFRSRVSRDNLDITFSTVREIVKGTESLLLAALSADMGDKIGMKQIGNPDTVIWMPAPQDANWFKNLTEEGYNGKRILLPTLKWMRRNFQKDATDVINIPTKNMIDRVLEIVRR